MTVVALSFATPVALWAFAVGAPLVAAHLYFRKRRVRAVPFLGLLQESLGPIRRQARFKKLYDALALACRLIALGCLVLALAGVQPAQAQREPEDTAFVLDADVTTAARERDGRTRFAHGLALLRAQVRALPATPAGFLDRVVVVRAGRVPTLLVSPTRNREAALAALTQVDGPEPHRADLAAATETALYALRGAERARVVLLTSRQTDEPKFAAGRRLQALGIGETREDQTLASVRIARRPDGQEYRIEIQLRNDALGPRTRSVRVRVGTRDADQQSVEVPAEGDIGIVTKVPAPVEALPLVVELMDEDAFPIGDRVNAWLPAAVRPRVIAIHDGSGIRPYTRAVLEALVDEIQPTKSGSAPVAQWDEVPEHDLTIVDGAALPKGGLKPGAYLFLGPLQGALPFEVNRAVANPLVWRSDPNHPLTADLDFGTAHAVRGWTLKPNPNMVPLAFVEGEPVVAEGVAGDVRYVVLALDPEGSALPIQAAFPLLVRNAMRRLIAAPRAPLPPLVRVGDILRPEAPLAGGSAVQVRWDGWGANDLIGDTAGARQADLAPTGTGWRVPPDAVGAAQVRSGDAVVARTGIANFDPTRTIVPARPAALLPKPADVRAGKAQRWRTGLIALCALFLLLDLALIRPRRARSA